MQGFNLICDVPYLYATKAERGWGGLDYEAMISRIGEIMGLSLAKATALVKRGPKQGKFLAALEAYGFDITLANHVDRDGNILPQWDQACYEGAISLLRSGPEGLALVLDDSADYVRDVAAFAISNWDSKVLLASLSAETLAEVKAEFDEEDLSANLSTLLIDQSLCKG